MTLFCIGRNYQEHARELNNPIPTSPIIFCKPATAVLKENRPFYIPDFSNNIHYEVEILLRIGKNGKRIDSKKAWEFISHIGLGIDFTARDLQDQCKSKSHPWEIAKAFDNSAVIGEWIDKSEWIDRPIPFSLSKNKQTVQSGNSSHMIFSIPELLQHISRYFTLMQGDVIFTGTPEGVGPIAIGDLLEGYLGDRRMFWTEIK